MTCGTSWLFGFSQNPLYPFKDYYTKFPSTVVLCLFSRCLWDLSRVLLFSHEHKGMQEVHIFLLWAQGNPQHWRISMCVYSVIYIISISSYPGNILKFIDNKHWIPNTVFCLMYSVWFLSSDSALLEWWYILLCFADLTPPTLSGTRNSEDFLAFQ